LANSRQGDNVAYWWFQLRVLKNGILNFELGYDIWGAASIEQPVAGHRDQSANARF